MAETMKQQQVTKTSGLHYDVNLDPVSLTALFACQQRHKDNQNNFSISVIVRRALRSYFERLEGLHGDKVRHEVIETQRAAKGIL